MVATVEVPVEGVEVEGHHVAAAHRQIEDGRPPQQALLAPGLAAHDERRARSIAPFEDDRAAVFRAVETGRAVRHSQPGPGRVVERVVLAEDVGAGRIAVGERVTRSREAHPQMRAWRARGRIALAEAERRAALGAAHTTHDPAFECKHRAASQGDEKAALLDETLELRDALPA